LAKAEFRYQQKNGLKPVPIEFCKLYTEKLSQFQPKFQFLIEKVSVAVGFSPPFNLRINLALAKTYKKLKF